MTEIAAAILLKDGQILICQRGMGGNCSLLWEFPGGKREGQEQYADCAIRECREELNIEIEILKEFAGTDYCYEDKPFHFVFYLAKIQSGSIEKRVHRQIRWVKPRELAEYPFCPADVEIVERLSRENLQSAD
ncbi:(deoxy)nucleoside triphosphate pyrophosphohydrolase [Candidatus Soleaferrea massiliensis]|uniref:(deoxy)nucleoside triphosphate pyrophosphohydrolase n=1 Tax=Candidatus Soleaferrea massiliensis TaxID=1470354 RepID=UPI00058D960A|nr:(deoxy)nucleoside triphosphate pyrophosphohydrolase [Candidatus Soleaferrea massiliensis]